MSYTQSLKPYTLKYLKHNVFLAETIVALCVIDFLGCGYPTILQKLLSQSSSNHHRELWIGLLDMCEYLMQDAKRHKRNQQSTEASKQLH
jgi:hypothetical protein